MQGDDDLRHTTQDLMQGDLHKILQDGFKDLLENEKRRKVLYRKVKDDAWREIYCAFYSINPIKLCFARSNYNGFYERTMNLTQRHGESQR